MSHHTGAELMKFEAKPAAPVALSIADLAVLRSGSGRGRLWLRREIRGSQARSAGDEPMSGRGPAPGPVCGAHLALRWPLGVAPSGVPMGEGFGSGARVVTDEALKSRAHGVLSSRERGLLPGDAES